MSLPITLTAAGAAAFLNIWLTIRIGTVRAAKKISVGDGGDEGLVRRMRAQANFIENTPIVLILIGAIEFSRAGSVWLAGIATLYTLGRVAHGVGMDGGPFGFGRNIGTTITLAVQFALAVWAVTIALNV